ncbi:acyltransferase family protein [Microvirga soli]|uniref:acyltransferase family protein n=1 Tax=Microvirga soli TaxID=1854496 RepID=UPI00192007A9|nr:acyltransferase [Microvirga soli]
MSWKAWYKVDLEVTALGTQNSAAKGSEVWIRLSDPAAPFPALADAVPASTGWETRNERVFSKGLPPSPLKWHGKVSQTATLTFDQNPFGGNVEVRVGKIVKRFDLYADKPGELRVALATFSGFRSFPDQTTALVNNGVLLLTVFAVMAAILASYQVVLSKVKLPQTHHKNSDIEYIRAVAVFITVFAHLKILVNWPSEELTWIFSTFVFGGGVDLFFCVSGYVISKSLFRSIDQAQDDEVWVTMKNFWVRRAFRLLPSAWLWALFYIPASFFIPEVGSLWLNFKNQIAVLTFTANLRDQQNLMAIYWTLASEEQFYFVLPFFALLCPPAWRWKLVLLAALGLFFAGLGLWFNAMQMDKMIWGVLIYFFSETKAYRIFEPTLLKSKVAALGASAILLLLLVAIPTAIPEVRVSLTAIVCAITVWLASYGKGYFLPLPYALHDLFLWVGERSYAIYLIHGPAFYLTFALWREYAAASGIPIGPGIGLSYVLTAAVIILLLSNLNFLLLETPLREYGRKITSRRPATVANANEPIALAS